MPFYHRLGEIPRVKHTTFYKPDGKSLYREELFGSKGFSGVYSTKYHIHMPTALKRVGLLDSPALPLWHDAPLSCYHFFTDRKESSGDFISARNVFLHNDQCTIATSRITKNTDDFYRNSNAAEYLFVHHGTGVLLSEFGKLPFGPGDQIIIPRAVTYQLRFDELNDNYILIVESATAYEIPKHFRNEYGQLEEHAPYCERDFKLPEFMTPVDESGDFRIVVKAGEKLFEHIAAHHPFDVVGWDGFLYPYSFNIKDYHAKVGRIHLPPPVHLAFITGGFVVCNFVPRPYDFHDESIPAPYFHSNIDSDEVLYYVEGEFMSRRGVKESSITLHPGGMPHGPQPGRTEASVGAKGTNEYAVMIDTFSPLRLTRNVRETMDETYVQSWLE